MVTNLEKEAYIEDISVSLQLPVREFSARSHAKNIDYCIKQIKNYSRQINDPVVGYWKLRLLGLRESDYIILSHQQAENLKKENSDFNYHTLNDFLSKKEDIESGKYILNEDGLIVDINPICLSTR